MTTSIWESKDGLGVQTHYGERHLQDGTVAGGKLPNSGAVEEVVVYISGRDFNGATSFDTRATLPAGAVVLEAIAEITTAFTLGNADNDIYVGTNGSESTNYGMQLATPASTGTVVDAPAGTWAAPLAAETAIGVAVAGTTPSAADGEAKVVVRYQKI